MIKALNAHAKKAREFITKSRGWLVKQNEDSFLAVFKNAPDSLEFARSLYKTTGVKDFKMRAGIHVGLVNVVPSETLGFDIDGVTVVKAHRVIEKIGEGHGIWISQEVKTHLGEDKEKRHGRVKWKVEGEFDVKGVEGLQTFYSMISSKTKKTSNKDSSLFPLKPLTIQTAPELFDVLISLNEHEHLEFKSSARWDFKRNIENKALEAVVVKSVAGFLNTDGGCLLIGVGDEKPRELVGLTNDFKTLNKQNPDGYINYLTQLLLDSNFGNDISNLMKNIYVFKKNEKDVCMVVVGCTTKDIWVKNGNNENFLFEGLIQLKSYLLHKLKNI